MNELEIHGSPKSLKIICEDGVTFCDRFLFILWSKNWRNILDPNEESSVLICPEMKKEIIELVIMLLKTGTTKGLENNFENFFDTVLDIFDDLPNGFTNFETSEKSFEKKAKNLIARRNTFKGLRLNGYVCEYCLSLFASQYAKERHIIYYHTNQSLFYCPICHSSFRTKEGLVSHEKAKHRENQGNFICTICDVKFENESSLKRHMKIIDHEAMMEISYICIKCDHIFKTRKALEEHKDIFGHNENTENLICKMCDVTFENEYSLKRHMKRHIDHEAMKNKSLVCDKMIKCDKIFETRKALEEHKKKCGHNEHKEEKKQDKKFKEMIKCTESGCTFETSRPDSLLRHQRLKHGLHRKDFKAVRNTLADGGKWTCSKCGKTFTSNSEVQRHVIQCEENKCEFCDKTFTMKQNLKRHIEKKHSAYTCELCKKRFKNGWLLREHIVDKVCEK